MFTERVHQKNDCWFSDRQAYTYIFWNELIGKSDEQMFELTDRFQILANLKSVLNDDYLQSKRRSQDDMAPLITGQFNDWNPQPMINIKDFVMQADVHGRPTLRKLAISKGFMEENSMWEVED